MWLHFVIFVSCFLSFPCSLVKVVITCWEMADLMALLCFLLSLYGLYMLNVVTLVNLLVFVTFPYVRIPGQVWYLIVVMPDVFSFLTTL